MRIAAITNPLHVMQTPSVRRGDEHHYLVIRNITTRSLVKNHVCHEVPDDVRSPVICNRGCVHFRYCEFGQEYIRRTEL